jgi:hypothetical protein
MFREKSDQILDFVISLLLECRPLLGSSPPAKRRHRAAVNTKMQIFRLLDRDQTGKQDQSEARPSWKPNVRDGLAFC